MWWHQRKWSSLLHGHKDTSDFSPLLHNDHHLQKSHNKNRSAEPELFDLNLWPWPFDKVTVNSLLQFCTWVLLKNYAFWVSMKRMMYTESLFGYSKEINGVSYAWIIKWIFQNQISPLSLLYFEIFQGKGQFCMIFRHPFCDMDLCIFVCQVFQRIRLTFSNKKWPGLKDYVISFKSIPNFPKIIQRFSH